MNDIRPIRDRKVRILNGSHTAMVPVALQSGCQTVKDAFDIPEIETYITRMVESEILPVITGDQQERCQFADKILERFYNPFLQHYLKDISLNSLSKWETRNYPTVFDNAKLNRIARLNLFSFAALLLLYSGQSQATCFIPNDLPEHISFIQQTYNRNKIHDWVTGIVTNKEIWENDFTQIPRFINIVSDMIEKIRCKGILEALKNELI